MPPRIAKASLKAASRRLKASSVAQVIDPSAVDGGGKVVFGATVELEDEDTGDLVKYQIVGKMRRI